jgi:hypothetical protein
VAVEKGGTPEQRERVYADMEQWSELRRRVLVERVSQCQVLRETGMLWKTPAHLSNPGLKGLA